MSAAVVRLVRAGRTFPGPPPVTALQPSDLTVDQREYLAVLGPARSGKSTLLRLLALLDTPSTGGFTLDGLDTWRLPPRDRATLRGRRIGLLLRSAHLLPDRTVEENVRLARLYHRSPRSARDEAVRTALDRVGLGHRAPVLPAELSDGERQRVALARALVNRPGLLLCDEPTDGLDRAESAVLLDLLDRVPEDGCTVILGTREPAVAARAGRTVRIADGRLDLPRAA